MNISTWIPATPDFLQPDDVIFDKYSETPGGVIEKVIFKPLYVGVTAPLTAKTTRQYAVDTAAVAAFTITLPTTPQVGDWIEFIDATSNFASANLTLSSTDSPINTGTAGTAASPATLVCATAGMAFRLIYINATVGWLQLNNTTATTGTSLALTGAASATTFTANSGTTPQLITAAGKTNTGNLTINGKTSGSLIVTTADASAYALTILAAARTVGTATITIPDTANVADTFALVTKAQTLANKTLTAPVIGAATGTSVALTGAATAASFLATGTAGIGYGPGGAGTGGAVTQGTSRTTGVTLSTITGAITLYTAAPSAGVAGAASFTVTNTLVAATDTILVSVKSSTTNVYIAQVTAVAAGTFQITVFTTGGTTSDAPVVNFSVIKGVAT
jgi:hypothetical protein